jgi:hypothetical protein
MAAPPTLAPAPTWFRGEAEIPDDVEVPRDPESGPELDALLRNAPTFSDPPRQPRRSPWSEPRPSRSPAPRAAAPSPPVGGAFGAFSLVVPLGISDRVSRAPIQGDGTMNVVRQNNTWLGFSNGSRRG